MGRDFNWKELLNPTLCINSSQSNEEYQAMYVHHDNRYSKEI